VVVDDGLANARRGLWIEICVSELLHCAVIEIELPSEVSI